MSDEMSAMYALAVDMVPEQKPMKTRAATSHEKLGARPEANAPKHAPLRVRVRMAFRPTASLSGPSQALETSCAMAKLENMKPSDAVAPPNCLHTGSSQLVATSALVHRHSVRT